MPLPRQCFNDTLNAGKPLAGGFLYTCVAGTSCPGNPQATYTDSTGLFLNQNPITLDGAGCASIWLTSGTAYKIVAQNSFGVQEWSADNVTGLATQLTTSFAASTTVAFTATPTFSAIAQNQLFKMTLTGNVTASNLVMTGISAPSVVTFELIQDGTGGRTFSFPPNTSGSVAIDSCANCITTEVFLWDGAAAYLIASSASWSNAGSFASAVSNIFDLGLSANSLVCTNGSLMLTTSCGGIIGSNQVTFNGQTVSLGGSSNVNAGAATHSMALNEGNGNVIAGVTLALDQIPVGQNSADPIASSAIPACPDTNGNHLNYASGGTFSCGTSNSAGKTVQSYVRKQIVGGVGVSQSVTTTVTSQSVSMPSSGCPCRIFVDWQMFFSTSNSGQYDGGITDGTNSWAISEMNTTGSASSFAASSSGWSPSTYANNANVTISLQTRSNSAGYTVSVNSGGGLGGVTGMDIVVMTSN